MNKVVVSLSGGLDSTILLYKMVKDFGKENVFALSFSYGQRHDIELFQAKKTAKYLDIQHKIVDIGFLGEMVKDVSAMVKGDIPTPTMGDLEDQKEVITYVPFRNMILTSITLAFAESIGANNIALGVQYGDYASEDGSGNKIYHYWDTSKKFTYAIQNIIDLNDKHSIQFLTPFIEMTKAEEINLGLELGVRFEDTWTCYAGKIDGANSSPLGLSEHFQPCGVCPSCVGRAEAFTANNLIDPVVEHGVIR